MNIENKGVLYDLDGTLVNTESYGVEVVRKVLRKAQISASEEIVQQYLHMADDEYFNFVIENTKTSTSPETLLQLFESTYIAELEANAQPQPNALGALFTIHKSVEVIGMVTASTRDMVNIILKGLRIEKYFQTDKVITANDVQQGKPNPEGYTKGSIAIKKAPKDIIVFEDTRHGIQAALNAGIGTVIGVQNNTSNNLSNAHVVIDSFEVFQENTLKDILS